MTLFILRKPPRLPLHATSRGFATKDSQNCMNSKRGGVAKLPQHKNKSRCHVFLPKVGLRGSPTPPSNLPACHNTALLWRRPHVLTSTLYACLTLSLPPWLGSSPTNDQERSKREDNVLFGAGRIFTTSHSQKASTKSVLSGDTRHIPRTLKKSALPP